MLYCLPIARGTAVLQIPPKDIISSLLPVLSFSVIKHETAEVLLIKSSSKSFWPVEGNSIHFCAETQGF